MATLRTFRTFDEADRFVADVVVAYSELRATRERALRRQTEPHKTRMLDRLARRALNHRAAREAALASPNPGLDAEEAVLWPLLETRLDEQFDAELADAVENS